MEDDDHKKKPNYLFSLAKTLAVGAAIVGVTAVIYHYYPDTIDNLIDSVLVPHCRHLEQDHQQDQDQQQTQIQMLQDQHQTQIQTPPLSPSTPKRGGGGNNSKTCTISIDSNHNIILERITTADST